MSPRKASRDAATFDMWPEELLSAAAVAKKLTELRALRHPVWSDQKARLIERYLYYFVMVTKHGTYIDGFAGPQAPEHLETWSAKRVLESKPRFLRRFFLCEIEDKKVAMLKQLWKDQPPKAKGEAKRQCSVLSGDFNAKVDEILSCGEITEKEATFALLDQRTFECHWDTVRKLAQHKKAGHKIELFYFLAVKWLHRSLAGLANETVPSAWWGNDGWTALQGLSQWDITMKITARFKDELGYGSVTPYPIYEKEDGQGSIMYYMIHASDHPDAPGLMWRAYDKTITEFEKPPEQRLLDLRAELPSCVSSTSTK